MEVQKIYKLADGSRLKVIANLSTYWTTATLEISGWYCAKGKRKFSCASKNELLTDRMIKDIKKIAFDQIEIKSE